MYNLICAPEMSVKNEDKAPHAYIQFDIDEEKEMVPLSFIYSFPKTWRETGWDKGYLFKIFWSPESEDTPARMLKRVPEIPVHEKGSTLSKAGYYRASVLLVKETLKDLEEAISSKRISAGPLKLKYSSFDGQGAAGGQDRRSSSSGKDGKDKKISQSNANQSKKRKKGINKDAQRDNVYGLRTDLANRFDFLSNKKEKNYSDDDGDQGKQVDGETYKKDSGASVSQQVPKAVVKQVSPYPARARKHNRVELEGSDSDENELTLGDKKVKLDPDYNPKKYQELEDELRIMQSNLKKAHDLNSRLRKTLQEAEEENKSLRKQLEVKSWAGEMSENVDLNSTCEVFINDGHAGSTDTQPAVLEMQSTSDDEPKPATSSKLSDNSESTEKGYELMEGVFVPSDVWKIITLIPPGKKKDNTFIKDLTIAAHGPQCLATSTILGTKKGGRKKEDGNSSTPKPGLNKKVLKAVRDLLIQRVEQEEGKLDDPDEHDRTKLSVYHEAIRGAQKRVLSLGYGPTSNKSNAISVNVLMGQ